MKLDDVMEDLEDNEALLLDPQDQFNPCLVGTGYLFHHGPVAVYDIAKVMRYFDDKGVEPLCECLACGAVVGSFDVWWEGDCPVTTDAGHVISWLPYPWPASEDDAAPESP
jgi:hypothetical protein